MPMSGAESFIQVSFVGGKGAYAGPYSTAFSSPLEVEQLGHNQHHMGCLHHNVAVKSMNALSSVGEMQIYLAYCSLFNIP